MKMYRSPQYRKVLAFLLRAGKPVLTKKVLAVLGVPPNPSDLEYAHGYAVVCRLVARGWVAASPAPAGHVNLVSLTEAGLAVAREWETEVSALVSIYAGPTPPIPVKIPLPQDVQQEPLSMHQTAIPNTRKVQEYVSCDFCSERLSLNRAEVIYKEHERIKCNCGNDLTAAYLELVDGNSAE
ncbi:MAG TPA: hypothetical protein VKK79_14875 [Candidatus Lokiarchaeia archaeon]|nr:hypothetical protein [Candidatus Lokiarchaeia archaeon]